MTLLIRYECPQCNQELPLNLLELAPGRRQFCKTCQTPGRMTQAGLDRFSEDLHQYFRA